MDKAWFTHQEAVYKVATRRRANATASGWNGRMSLKWMAYCRVCGGQ